MSTNFALGAAILALGLPGRVFPADCDSNGIDDAADIASGAADCDGDGTLDACEVLDVVRFHPIEEIPAPESSISRIMSLTMADLDDDGTPELVAGGGPPTLAVFRRGGSAGLELTGEFFLHPERLSLVPLSLQAVDMNSDGQLDVVAGCDGGSLSVLLNEGDGRLGAPSFHSYFTLRLFNDFSAQHVPVHDADGDGDLDVALGHPSNGKVTFLTNDGSGALARAHEAITTSAWSALFAEDFDNDGDRDFLAARDGPAVSSLVRSNGDGTFGSPEEFTLDHGAVYIQTADMNGDGSLDLVYQIDNDSFGLQLNGGRGIFAPQRRYLLDYPHRVVIGDVDRDLDLDLAVRIEHPGPDGEDYSTVTMLLNDGDGLFRMGGENDIPPTHMFFLGDVDANVGLDLIVTTWEPGRLLVRKQESSQTGVDCDGNGIPDACDIEAKRLHDEDGNGMPDECERPFHRGDADANGVVDIGDALFILSFLFLRDTEPPCLDAADFHGYGELDISDAVSMLGYLFLGYEQPAAPGAPGFPCGRDQERPGMTGNLGCKEYASCDS
jgi:hypothetical protein